ncbi:C4-dicarboxylate ABC transporter [Vineibacter terrae]|uniref:C4-dicarboxylate ABC transporter n=1 Tax=Vineibacter terrae TaxID=2586908 RepID=A0A5C8P974_9HYPH|nr:tellurite resistance/C4-dicarboxylate transporter family protein [Vineibacter terrae]TXL69942.1 C4-dicarboxylate ABC transporter [Vineibacter terrae]
MRLRFARGRRDDLQTLHPAYFALVMATGIVSIAARLHGMALVPTALFWLNAVFLAGLVSATGVRILRFPDAVAADIRSHSRGVGFFTMVAAIAVFGTQCLLLGATGAAFVFWVAAMALWVVITYGVLAALMVKPDKPALAEGLNGGWLVIVVAAQSVAILTVLVSSAAAIAAEQRALLMFVALVLWLGGAALYLGIMTLILLRYMFASMAPEDLTPPYWINMGAVAISTLAGATLAEHAGVSPVISEIVLFVKEGALFFWAIATLWIPMLLVLGVWRYLIRGVPFSYDPLYWGGVFPLGMYCVATYHLTRILDVPFLVPLSQVFLVLALVAWAAAFVGLLDSRLNRLPRVQASD